MDAVDTVVVNVIEPIFVCCGLPLNTEWSSV